MNIGPILVTGGAGFIGSHIADRLLAEGLEVVVLDNFDPYYSRELKERNLSVLRGREGFTFVEGDITHPKDVEGLFSRFGFDCVFHEAAQAGVRVSVEDPNKPNKVNVQGTLNLLQAAVRTGVRLFVNASSSSVYGKVVYRPFDEAHPTSPVSPYGVSKLAAEHYCRVFGELYGMSTVSLRYFTVYGPRMRPDLAIHIFTKASLNREKITIFGSGEKTRDFTYIDDIVEANWRMVKSGLPSGVYNIGYGSSISVNELAEKIMALAGSRIKVEHTDDVKGDAEHTLADPSLLEKSLGWRPVVNIEEGLKRYVQWVKKGSPAESHWGPPEKMESG